MSEVLFNQVVSRGCGLDVHKKLIVATIDGVGLKKETREFGATTSSLTELRDWLLANEVTHVAMESTGVFWKPVYNILEPCGLVVWVVNARHIKYVPGHKTDKLDSAWICKLLLAGLLKPSYIPPKQQRELRDLTRYRKKLIQAISSDKNRIIRVLEDCNVKLSSVLSDTQGSVGTKIVDRLISGELVTMEFLNEIYHKKLKASKDEIYEACQGFMTENNIFLLKLMKENITALEKSILELNEKIRIFLSPYDNVIELLKKVPGISSKSVEDLIAEIGLDMNAFPDERHLASWVGVSPGNNESGGKKKSGRITHGNNHARTTLVEIAWGASLTKNTFYSERYHRIAAKRGRKRALIAVGHSILKSVYHIIKGTEEYIELGADYVTKKIETKRREYYRKQLEELGYHVVLDKQKDIG